jgi:redox-sensitive bicupin YhaK (pirin superfamily)
MDMKNSRKIKMILTRKPAIEGAGVHLNRVFGFSESPQLDPFLMLDDFRSDNPQHYLKGFPWHPHRGIETITCVTKGDVERGDSLGNKGGIQTVTFNG